MTSKFGKHSLEVHCNLCRSEPKRAADLLIGISVGPQPQHVAFNRR
jgi:hypothetical protein